MNLKHHCIRTGRDGVLDGTTVAEVDRLVERATQGEKILIHLHGGVAVLAHPGTNHRDDLIPDLVGMGLDGLEAYHHSYAQHTIVKYKNLARKLGLIYTGGSDCHGARSGRLLIGSNRVPYKCLVNLKKAKDKRVRVG